jgi:hypothetical protein
MWWSCLSLCTTRYAGRLREIESSLALAARFAKCYISRDQNRFQSAGGRRRSAACNRTHGSSRSAWLARGAHGQASPPKAGPGLVPCSESRIASSSSSSGACIVISLGTPAARFHSYEFHSSSHDPLLHTPCVRACCCCRGRRRCRARSARCWRCGLASGSKTFSDSARA